MKNLHKKILVIIFAAMFLILPVMSFIFMPKSQEAAFSENENRYLARYIEPDFPGYAKNFFNKKPNNIKDKRFMNGFDSWFADRFILRENWIILQNQLELLQGKTEINGVFTVDGRMILAWKEDEIQDSVTQTILKSVDSFAERMNSEFGTESYIMLIPTAQEIYMDLLPPNSQPGNQTMLIKNCYDGLENMTNIDAATHLFENSGSYIYYRTDHHWTAYGSYWGYHAAAKKMGIIPYELGRFDAEHASSDFRGTLFSKTLDFKITPDVVTFYTLSPVDNYLPEIKMTVNTGSEITVHDSLYFREFLDEKDKYAAFTGQNSPIMDIETDLENNDKSLLIFKDSFAHCMIPFLVNHYKRITVLDMRYLNTDIRDYVQPQDYSQILFVFSAPNFAEDTNLRKLDMTK